MKTPISVDGARPFQIERHSFTIGNSADAYTLQVSVDYDGVGDPSDFHFYNYSDEIPANGGVHEVSGVSAGLWWRLYGNTQDVLVRF